MENIAEKFVEYANIPPVIGRVISAGKATLHELETVYSVEDVYLLLEIIMVDVHNQMIVEAAARE